MKCETFCQLPEAIAEIAGRALFQRRHPSLDWDKSLTMAIDGPYQFRAACLRDAALALQAVEAAGYEIRRKEDSR